MQRGGGPFCQHADGASSEPVLCGEGNATLGRKTEGIHMLLLFDKYDDLHSNVRKQTRFRAVLSEQRER